MTSSDLWKHPYLLTYPPTCINIDNNKLFKQKRNYAITEDRTETLDIIEKKSQNWNLKKKTSTVLWELLKADRTQMDRESSKQKLGAGGGTGIPTHHCVYGTHAYIKLTLIYKYLFTYLHTHIYIHI